MNGEDRFDEGPLKNLSPLGSNIYPGLIPQQQPADFLDLWNDKRKEEKVKIGISEPTDFLDEWAAKRKESKEKKGLTTTLIGPDNAEKFGGLVERIRKLNEGLGLAEITKPFPKPTEAFAKVPPQPPIMPPPTIRERPQVTSMRAMKPVEQEALAVQPITERPPVRMFQPTPAEEIIPRAGKTLLGGFYGAAQKTAEALNSYAEKLGDLLSNVTGLDRESLRGGIFKQLSDNWGYYAQNLGAKGLNLQGKGVESAVGKMISGIGAAGFDIPAIMAFGPQGLAVHGAIMGGAQDGVRGAAIGAAQGWLMKGMLGGVARVPAVAQPALGGVAFALTAPGGIKEKAEAGTIGAVLSLTGGKQVKTWGEFFDAYKSRAPKMTEHDADQAYFDITGQKRPKLTISGKALLDNTIEELNKGLGPDQPLSDLVNTVGKPETWIKSRPLETIPGRITAPVGYEVTPGGQVIKPEMPEAQKIQLAAREAEIPLTERPLTSFQIKTLPDGSIEITPVRREAAKPGAAPIAPPERIKYPVGFNEKGERAVSDFNRWAYSMQPFVDEGYVIQYDPKTARAKVLSQGKPEEGKLMEGDRVVSTSQTKVPARLVKPEEAPPTPKVTAPPAPPVTPTSTARPRAVSETPFISWIRKQGGIDYKSYLGTGLGAGEVQDIMDSSAKNIFKKKGGGMKIGLLAEKAREEGYIKGNEAEDVLDAIEKELAGKAQPSSAMAAEYFEKRRAGAEEEAIAAEAERYNAEQAKKAAAVKEGKVLYRGKLPESEVIEKAGPAAKEEKYGRLISIHDKDTENRGRVIFDSFERAKDFIDMMTDKLGLPRQKISFDPTGKEYAGFAGFGKIDLTQLDRDTLEHEIAHVLAMSRETNPFDTARHTVKWKDAFAEVYNLRQKLERGEPEKPIETKEDIKTLTEPERTPEDRAREDRIITEIDEIFKKGKRAELTEEQKETLKKRGMYEEERPAGVEKRGEEEIIVSEEGLYEEGIPKDRLKLVKIEATSPTGRVEQLGELPAERAEEIRAFAEKKGVGDKVRIGKEFIGKWGDYLNPQKLERCVKDAIVALKEPKETWEKWDAEEDKTRYYWAGLPVGNFAKKVRQAVLSKISTDAIFRPIGGKETSIAFKAYPERVDMVVEKTIDAVVKMTKKYKDLKERNWRQLTFLASKPAKFDDLGAAERNKLLPAYQEVRKFFDEYAPKLKDLGIIDEPWPQSALNKLNEEKYHLQGRLNKAEPGEGKEKIRAKIKEAEEAIEFIKTSKLQYVHIPKMWLEAFFTKHAEDAPRIFSQLFRQRKTLDMEELADTLLDMKLIKKGDVDIRNIMAAYAHKAGHKMALADLFHAAEREGLIRPSEEAPANWQYLPRKEFPTMRGKRVNPVFAEYFEQNLQKQGFKNINIGKVFGTIKMLQFYNPVFLPVNNLEQMFWTGVLNNPIKLPGLVNKALHSMIYKDDNYWDMHYWGGFSTPFAPSFTETQKTIARRLGDSSFFKRYGEFAFIYPISWKIAWKMENFMRLINYHYYIGKGESPMTAAQLTAKSSGDYADVPQGLRKILNKVFFTPSFRITMMSAQDEMLNNFGKAVLGGKEARAGMTRIEKGMGKMAIGVAAGIALREGFFHVLGYKTDKFGIRYVKEVTDEEGNKKELVVYVATPDNVVMRFIGRWLHLPTKGLGDWLDRAKWDLHPIWQMAMEVAGNKNPAGENIYNPNDSKGKVVVDILKHVAMRSLPIIQEIQQEGVRGRKATGALYKDLGLLGRMLKWYSLPYLRGTVEQRYLYKMQELFRNFSESERGKPATSPEQYTARTEKLMNDIKKLQKEMGVEEE